MLPADSFYSFFDVDFDAIGFSEFLKIFPIEEAIANFESDLQNALQTHKSIVATSSGTAAIHLALQLLNVCKEDIVLCQDFTFVASAMPILYEKATPVFIDSEKSTGNIDCAFLEEAITYFIKNNKRPKAIIATHSYGVVYDHLKLQELSNKYSIPIIEDAAEAIGASVNGNYCGTLGTLGILSFNTNKTLTTFGGGALICKNNTVAEKARYLASQGKSKRPYYYHETLAYNYRMNALGALYGSYSLNSLTAKLSTSRQLFEYYSSAIKHFDGLRMLHSKNGIDNHWVNCLYVDKPGGALLERDVLIDQFRKNNIPYRLPWNPLHKQPIFKECYYFGNGISDYLFSQGICLPSSNVTTDDRKRIEKVIFTVFKN